MKKITILLLLVGMGVWAMAQTATINQAGDANNASVDQTGAGNKATVTQLEATTSTPIGVRQSSVIQSGQDNISTVTQKELDGGGHTTLKAKMVQVGSLNVGTQSSTAPNYNSGQSLDLYQEGDKNISTQIIERGYTNSFKAQVEGNENVTSQTLSANHSHGDIYIDGSKNTATQTLQGSNHGYHKNITIDQTGDNNSATQTFTGSGLGHVQKGTILQEGDWNKGVQVSDGPDQELLIEQTAGDDNVASQLVSGGNQFTSIVQTGSRNFSNTLQSGADNQTIIQQLGDDNVIGLVGTVDAIGAEQAGIANVLDVKQQGDRNTVTQYRPEKDVFSSIKQDGERNDMDIDQLGDDNIVGLGSFPYDGIDQNNNDNQATILQDGNANKVGRFYQKGSENVANITQHGDGNRIDDAHQAKLGVDPVANQLTVLQEGNDNYIRGAQQEGKNIIGTLDQLGNANTAYMQLSRTNAFGDIDQIGDGNDASLTINKSYIGDNNSGTIYQMGNDNVASEYVGQTDPSTTSSDNTMSITQTGDLNGATIWLEGSFNTATISQTATVGASAGISQLGNSNTGSIIQN